jgi:hypothetical protein
MANASKKHFGPGNQGKGAGTGGMTDIPPGDIGENTVLSNRDKTEHNDKRGLDSREIQTEQHRDHSANRSPDREREGGERK